MRGMSLELPITEAKSEDIDTVEEAREAQQGASVKNEREESK